MHGQNLVQQACQKGLKKPIDIRVYLDAPSGGAKSRLLDQRAADRQSDPYYATLCSSVAGLGHGFKMVINSNGTQGEQTRTLK